MPSDGQSLRGWWRSGDGVILNMATESETTVNMLHSLDRDLALQSEERFRRAETFPGNDDLALQALASFESLFSDAIESFAAEIFRGAFNRRHSSLPQQAQTPMQ
jgi:hypothetical protein